MIKFSELLIALFAASLPTTYVLLVRHFILKNEAEDLAALAASGPLEPHECCCEIAAKALAGKSMEKQAVTAH
ncbi:MAG: hypothetical protein HZA92_08305 [Verrucomicrobia bacterium]|nr:hypothetical protein [Verrucomicrobiota bacterium]